MYKTVGSAILRQNLAIVLDEIEKKKEKALIVTKKGREVASLVNLDFFEDLLAFSSPKYLASIKKARSEYKKGKYYTHEQVFGKP